MPTLRSSSQGMRTQIADAFNAAHRRGREAGSRFRPRSGSGTTPALVEKILWAGNLCAGLSLFPPLLATLAMAKEGEQKTILQVYVSSISAHEFLLGKIFAFMLVALPNAVLLLIAACSPISDLRLAGDPDAVSGGDALYAFAWRRSAR